MKNASVYQRKGRPVWYVSYFSAERLRRVHEATPFRLDHPQGEKRALAYATKMAAAASKARAEVDRSGVWKTWVDDFLADRFAKSQRTLERYTTAWAWIELFCKRHRLAAPAAVTYNDIMAFFKWRQSGEGGRGVSRNTAIVETRVWGAILTEAMRRGWIDRNPCDRLGLRRDAPRMKPEISDKELATIRAGLAALEGELPLPERWMSTSFEIAIHQGCRLQETSLPLSAFDLDAGTVTFRAKARRGQKNIFTTALHPGLRPLVVALREAGAVVTCTLPDGPSRHWFKFFRGHKLGHLCFHCTRVTVITRLARGGVPMTQAMRFVGHSSEQVHRIYQRLRADDLDGCLAALAGVTTAPMGKSPGDA